MVRISVINLACNEEATILALLREVRAQSVDGVRFEVIVIDGGSTDRTVALLEQHPDLYDRLIKQPKNGGKGAAVIAGLKIASGQSTLFVPPSRAAIEKGVKRLLRILYRPLRPFVLPIAEHIRAFLNVPASAQLTAIQRELANLRREVADLRKLNPSELGQWNSELRQMAKRIEAIMISIGLHQRRG
jgi:hypothetical protein